MLTPVTTTIEKYEFGQDNVSDNENHDENENDATEEDNTNARGVSFQVRFSCKDALDDNGGDTRILRVSTTLQ